MFIGSFCERSVQQMPNGFPGLVEYYNEFVPQNFTKRSGKPVTRRRAQQYAKQYNFPLVRIGHKTLIDPMIAAERLRQAQLQQSPAREPPRKPGRPKKADAGSGAASSK